MPRNRPVMRGRSGTGVQTPKDKRGTAQGMLFQVKKQIKDKSSHLDRMKGELAYLHRKAEKLERELLYMRSEVPDEGNTGHN